MNELRLFPSGKWDADRSRLQFWMKSVHLNFKDFKDSHYCSWQKTDFCVFWPTGSARMRWHFPNFTLDICIKAAFNLSSSLHFKRPALCEEHRGAAERLFTDRSIFSSTNGRCRPGLWYVSVVIMRDHSERTLAKVPPPLLCTSFQHGCHGDTFSVSGSASFKCAAGCEMALWPGTLCIWSAFSRKWNPNFVLPVQNWNKYLYSYRVMKVLYITEMIWIQTQAEQKC